MQWCSVWEQFDDAIPCSFRRAEAHRHSSTAGARIAEDHCGHLHRVFSGVTPTYGSGSQPSIPPTTLNHTHPQSSTSRPPPACRPPPSAPPLPALPPTRFPRSSSAADTPGARRGHLERELRHRLPGGLVLICRGPSSPRELDRGSEINGGQCAARGPAPARGSLRAALQHPAHLLPTCCRHPIDQLLDEILESGKPHHTEPNVLQVGPPSHSTHPRLNPVQLPAFPPSLARRVFPYTQPLATKRSAHYRPHRSVTNP